MATNKTVDNPGANADHTVVASHPRTNKWIGILGAVVGCALVAGGVVQRPIDAGVTVTGAAFAVFGTFLFVHANESLTASATGLVWTRLFRGTRSLDWGEIDAATDRETALWLRCSWRGVEIRASRWLVGFDEVVTAMRRHIEIDALLAPQWNVPLPASFATAWNMLTGIAVFVLAGIATAVVASIWHDPSAIVAACVLFGIALWQTPFLKCEVHADRLVLKKPLKSIAISYAQVTSVALDSTEFREQHGLRTGQLTSNRVVILLTDGEDISFAPRSGALAMGLCVNVAVHAWRKKKGQGGA